MTGRPVRYNDPSEDRLVLRHIERDLHERIIREAQRSFTDTATEYRIAVTTVVYRSADARLLSSLAHSVSTCRASFHVVPEGDVSRAL